MAVVEVLANGHTLRPGVEAVGTSVMSVSFYKTTRRIIRNTTILNIKLVAVTHLCHVISTVTEVRRSRWADRVKRLGNQVAFKPMPSVGGLTL